MSAQAHRLALGILLAISVAACNAVPLRTASTPVAGCDLALVSGMLTNNRPDGLALRAADASIQRVLWPFGYSSRGFVGSMELVGQTGVVIAHEGDFVQMSGGLNAEGIFVACSGTVARVAPPG